MKKALALVLIVLGILTASSLFANVESASELSSVDVQSRETSLGDLTADAVRDIAAVRLALIPAGSFREITIQKGAVSADAVIKGLQYPDDKIVVIEVTGEQLIKALERSVSIHPQKNLGFLQVSGLEFTFDAGASKGSRIISLKIGGNKVSSDQTYRVATTEPLAEGGYGYFTIWGKDLKATSTGKTTAQSVTEFLSKRSSVDYRDLSRISVKGK